MAAATRTTPVTFVSSRDDQGDSVLWVIGEVDDFTVPAFEAECERIASGSHSIIIDMSSCTFISSSGLGALLRLEHQCPGATVLVTKSEHFGKLLPIVGLDILPRFENIVDALMVAGKSEDRTASTTTVATTVQSLHV